MTAQHSIRPATADDWPAIWPIFREIVQAQETYAYPLDLTSEQASDLWLEKPPGSTVVLVDGERVLGTAKMGPNRPGPGDHIGTASFMVDSAARGLGVGRTLARHVIEIVGTVPRAFRSASHGYVGLHVMFLDLRRRS